MHHPLRLLVLLGVLFASISWAGDLPWVSVVSRDASSIGLETGNFEAKPKRELFYRVRHGGTDSGETKPLPDGPFTIPTAETGIYTLTIVSRKKNAVGEGANETIEWEQDLFAVRHGDRLSDPGLRERLAQAYAPVALFHRDEEFYPSSIPYILNEESPDPELAQETFQVRRGKLHRSSMSYSELAAFVSTHGERKNLLDTPRIRKVMKAKMGQIATTRLRFRTGSPEAATLYYSILEDPGNEKASINYHFFYAYDPKTGNADDPSKIGHVFDRESLTVILDTRTLNAEAVIFGAHLPGQTMGLFSTEGDEIVTWTGGRVAIPWDAVDRLSGHPLAAVAKGSHGIYPLPGLYAVVEAKVKILKEVAGGNRVLVPPETLEALGHLEDSTAVEVVPYELLDLGLGEATSSSWNRILIFSGSLVDVPGSTNARFPPFSTRETDPRSYAEQAAPWPAAEIPASARDHLALLIELLGASR
jgi:hypothetical protein